MCQLFEIFVKEVFDVLTIFLLFIEQVCELPGVGTFRFFFGFWGSLGLEGGGGDGLIWSVVD
jgi:hypothetical protein